MTGLAALQADDPRQVGSYVLLGRLGTGGMGRVYLARSPGGRQVAVKVIRPTLAEDSGFRERFAREVASARKVGGLFTAQVVDADLNSPLPWLVTAYVPGMSLAEAVDRQGPLPPATVLSLAAGLAEGLNAIHRAGVIHRDLKPSNVLLAPDGPRIIDFGIASAMDATSLTGAGHMVGSPAFMSPEQAQGQQVGPASDMFSLGGVLTYASRGQGAFGTGETNALLYRVVHGTPNLDGVPGMLRPLVSRCLARDPRQRPTPAEFLAGLTAAYPPAADLSDWLPARLADVSAQRTAAAAEPLTADTPAAAGPGLATEERRPGQGFGQARHGQEQPRRPRPGRRAWVAAGAAAAGVAAVVSVVLSLGHPTPAASARSGPSATPTVGGLQLNQFQAGDCLTGGNMQLNTSNPWPKVTRAVPCSQPHTAEVFLANDSFWPQRSSFPGSDAISKDGNAACNNAFRSYIGIGYSKSIYTWTNIIPDAATWPNGDRALHCIAYYSTSARPSGATMSTSIKGSKK